jgi:phosphoribosylformylglycinamidine (FGAM) synthase-like amidotransferase family enzyme
MKPNPKQCNEHPIQESQIDFNMYVNINFQSNNAQLKIQNAKSTVKEQMRSKRQEEIMLPIFHSQGKISLPIFTPPSKTHQLQQS